MNNIVVMKVVDCFKNLPYGLRGVFLGEFAVFADPVEELTACRQLSNNIIFVLGES